MGHDVEIELKDCAIIRGGLYLFEPKNALRVVIRCRQLMRKIYGIDAFLLHEGNKIQPFMEHSIDFSARRDNADNWDEAEKFISDRFGKGFVFEISYE